MDGGRHTGKPEIQGSSLQLRKTRLASSQANRGAGKRAGRQEGRHTCRLAIQCSQLQLSKRLPCINIVEPFIAVLVEVPMTMMVCMHL